MLTPVLPPTLGSAAQTTQGGQNPAPPGWHTVVVASELSWGPCQPPRHCHLPGDTVTFVEALPPAYGTLASFWEHCHVPRDTDTFCEDTAFLSGNTATFPAMSQPS